MVEVKAYTRGLITAIVAVVIAIGLLPTLLLAVGNVTGVPLLTTALVGIIVGAGIILFLVKEFI